MKTGLIFLALCLAIPTGFVKAESTYDSATISRDPFQKPELTKPLVKPSVNTETVEQPSEPSWRPHLIMTLRAGKNSMANVGGQVIRLGEKIDGYKLIEVYERSVVFVKQGKTTRLTLDKE